MAPAKRRASELNEPPTKRAHTSGNIDVETIISLLRLPNGVQVAQEFSNTKSTLAQVQAYAKLAGPSWTFYVQRLEVIIGRRAVDCYDPVDIDLGPSKIVSRRHAVLKYDLEQRNWVLEIIGRNGVRVDCVSHKSGTIPLHSGNIIDIGGVQMMFVLPDIPPQVNESLLKGLMQSQKPLIDRTSPQQSPSPTPCAPSPVVAPASSYPNGVAIVTRPQVREAGRIAEQDLSSDFCKDIKPPFSYATMISQAILSTEDSAMSLADIYQWISSHYSFYRHSKPGWQNSIRHNLSLNKAFEKVPRKENEPGKGSKWQITPKYREEFIRKANAGKLIKGRSQLQFRNSPVKQLPPQQQQQQQQQQQALAAKSQPGQQPIIVQHQAVAISPQKTLAQQLPPPQALAPPQPPQPTQPLPVDSLPSNGAKDEEPLLPQPLNHSPTRSTPWLSRFAPRLGEEQDRPYLEFLDSEYHANSPQQYNISQLEAYTPDRGSSVKRTPLKGSPAFWKYVHLSATPLKADEESSPVRVKKKDVAVVGAETS